MRLVISIILQHIKIILDDNETFKTIVSKKIKLIIIKYFMNKLI